MRISTFSLRAALLAGALSLPVPGYATTLQFTLEGNATFVSDAPLEKIQGTAAEATGTLLVDLGRLGEPKAEVRFPVAAMKTGNDARDRHLRTPDWLYAAKHPHITFTVSRLTDVTNEESKGIRIIKGTAHGAFSMRGVAKDMAIPVVLKWKGDKAKLTATFNVALADHKVESATGVIGKRVGKQIAVTVNLTGSVREANDVHLAEGRP